VEFDCSIEKNKTPFASLGLLLLFYIIGLIFLDTSNFTTPDTYRMDTYTIRIQTLDSFALLPVFKVQWSILSYYLIHFAPVHYGYSGMLLLYYMVGLEKATNKRIVLLTFFGTSILTPFIFGPPLFILSGKYSFLLKFFLIQSYYLGSSPGIWGTIGMSAPVCRKRKFFWVGIFLMLIPEFILKIVAGTGDITANVIHVLIFLITWFVSHKFIKYHNNHGKSGELKRNRKEDLPYIFGILMHGLIMIIYFIDQLGILKSNILRYIL